MWMAALKTAGLAIVRWAWGRLFPSKVQTEAPVIAQAQRDRADVLQSEVNAREEADQLRRDVRNDLHGDVLDDGRDGVFKSDANELREERPEIKPGS